MFQEKQSKMKPINVLKDLQASVSTLNVYDGQKDYDSMTGEYFGLFCRHRI